MSLERRINLKEDERLVSVVRASALPLALRLVAPLALVCVPLFFMAQLFRLETLGVIIFGASLALGFFFGLRIFVKWWFSVLAVTERRLVFIRQSGFFAREVAEIPYAKVQEASYRVKGLFATLCGYGSILIESAGSDEPLEMARVRHPGTLHALIADMQAHAAGGAGDFGEMLQAVSRLSRAQLLQLKGEVERAMRSSEVEPGVGASV